VCVRPAELIETSTDGSLGRSSHQVAQIQLPLQQQYAVRSSGVFGSKVSSQDLVSSSGDGRERSESGLDCQAPELRMSTDVQVKFAVEYVIALHWSFAETVLC